MPRRLLALASTLAVLLAGCAGGSGDDSARDTSGSESTAASDRAEEDAGARPDGDGDAKDAEGGGSVPESLDFTGTTVSGAAFEGAALAGRPTLLWFWAPWCPICRGQIPQVERLVVDHGGELNVIGIGSLDSADAIAGFADDVDGIIQLEDAEGELWKRFGVTEQSSFVLLDADGSVAFEAGYGGTDELDAWVDDVLG